MHALRMYKFTNQIHENYFFPKYTAKIDKFKYKFILNNNKNNVLNT